MRAGKVITSGAERTFMRQTLQIENIDQLRLRQGIDDVELREKIGQLQVGDCVNLTFLKGAQQGASKTVPVQIVRIVKEKFEGKLLKSLGSLGPTDLKVGSMISFRRYHVHSITRADQ